MMVHLYWGRNRPLGWMQYMTVVSLRKHNPDVTIIVWTPKQPVDAMAWRTGEQIPSRLVTRKDWFASLSDFAVIREVELEVPVGISEVQRSDLFRWHILEELGGIWCDFDIFWQAPLTSIFPRDGWDIAICYLSRCGKKIVNLRGMLFLSRKLISYMPIGLLGCQHDSALGAEFFRCVKQAAWERVSPEDYQSAGRFALEAVELPKTARVLGIDAEAVYSLNACDMDKVWERGILTNRVASAPAIHWYAGHPSSVIGQDMIDARLSRHTGNALIDKMRKCYYEVQHTNAVPVPT